MNLPLTCCRTMTDASNPSLKGIVLWDTKPSGGWLLECDHGEEMFYIRYCPWCGAKLPEEPKAPTEDAG